MEKLLPILNDLLIVTANLIIFTRMISWKNPNLRNKIIIYTGCTIIIAAYFLATYFYDVPASLSAALCMTFPSLVLFWIFSECKDSRFFLTFCFVDTVSLIIGFFGRYGRQGGYLCLLFPHAFSLCRHYLVRSQLFQKVLGAVACKKGRMDRNDAFFLSYLFRPHLYSRLS